MKKKKTVFYQSSMPRAGSTLLQNVFGQNPNFYVTPTSPLCEFVQGAKTVPSYSEEMKAQDVPWQNSFVKAWVKGGIQGYAEHLGKDKKYILDKSRAWINTYNYLNWLNLEPKIVVMVRSLEEVLASFEIKYQSNPQHFFGIENSAKIQNITQPERLVYYMNSFPLGMYISRLRDSIDTGQIRNMHVVRYEDFCSSPETVVSSIYDFFGIETFNHDFQDIKQITYEDDKIHGPFGDHKIREGAIKISPYRASSLFPKETLDNIRATNKWFYDLFGYTF